MIKSRVLEILMGVIVLFLAVFFLILSYSSGHIKQEEGYVISALFDRVDGLSEGAVVRISGVDVGQVESMELEVEDGVYQAKVFLRIKDIYKISTDTYAKVVSDGLLGDKYILLSPGYKEKFIEPNGFLTNTQSSIILEDVMTKMLFGVSKKKNNET